LVAGQVTPNDFEFVFKSLHVLSKLLWLICACPQQCDFVSLQVVQVLSYPYSLSLQIVSASFPLP